MSGQTVETQIRLLLEEQSDQGLHYLPFWLYLIETSLYRKANLLKNIAEITANLIEKI